MTQDKYHPIPGEMDSIDCLRKERDELKEQLHKARTLWCDSKRDPETGYVDIKYYDDFEKAISL